MRLTLLRDKINTIISLYGDIESVDINFGSEDYPNIQVREVELAIVTHPIDLKTKVLIFD